MSEKTIQGKKCPHCASFVKDGLKICPVCGSSMKPADTRDRSEIQPARPEQRLEEQKTLDIGAGAGLIICDRCGTENGPDFKFCKICKHPLKKPDDSRSNNVSRNLSGKPASIRLVLEWKPVPAGFQAPDQIELWQFHDFFNAAGEWLGYAFLVFQTDEGNKILIRKTDPDSVTALFRKRSAAFCIESGREFYLGAVRFQVLGDFDEPADSGTVLRAEKTVLKGPGERYVRSDKKGRPRIRLFDIKSAVLETEIREKILLGRDWLFENMGCDVEGMRKDGISRKHANLCPMAGGLWLLEPLNDKPVFETIDRNPVVIDGGECLRYLSPSGPVEFTVTPEPGKKE